MKLLKIPHEDDLENELAKLPAASQDKLKWLMGQFQQQIGGPVHPAFAAMIKSGFLFGHKVGVESVMGGKP